MYSMFTEWRHGIRYKKAFSCLDSYVECAGWRPESEMKVLHAEYSKFQSKTLTVAS